MELPENFWKALTLVGGFTMFVIGISFAYKFVQAAFTGKVAYWSGLEKFGFLFFPITVFISPMLIHLPFDPKHSLCKWRQELWVHLFFGPIFFVSALMFMTSGADLMGLPGSTSLNAILTLNRSDVPPCIVYSPPFNYRFPFVKKATRTVLKALTIRIKEDKKDAYNAFTQRGDVDVEDYSKNEYSEWFEDEKPVAPPPKR